MIARFYPDHSTESIIKSTSNQTESWSLKREKDSLVFTVQHKTLKFTTIVKLKTGVWNQYAFSFNGKSLKAYVNGQLVETSLGEPQEISSPESSESAIVLGNPGSYIKTDYDDIGIWHKALSTKRIEKIYQKILGMLY